MEMAKETNHGVHLPSDLQQAARGWLLFIHCRQAYAGFAATGRHVAECRRVSQRATDVALLAAMYAVPHRNTFATVQAGTTLQLQSLADGTQLRPTVHLIELTV
jgi:hypothetical protein